MEFLRHPLEMRLFGFWEGRRPLAAVIIPILAGFPTGFATLVLIT